MRGKTHWQVFALASVVLLGLALGFRQVTWGQGAGGGPGTDPGNTFPLAQASLHAGEYLNYAMTNIGNMVITVTITTFRADGSTVGTQTVDVAPKHIETRQVSYVEACGLACDPPPVGEAQVWSQATVSRNASNLLTGCAVKDVITNAVKQNVCGTARGDARFLLGL